MSREGTDWSLDRRKYVKGAGAGLASVLAGCGGGGGGGGTPTPTPGGGQQQTQTQQQQKATEILYWTAFADDSNLKPWHKWYKKQAMQRYNIDVTLSGFAYKDLRKKYLTGARTGTPDLIEGVLSHVSDYVKADLMEPIGQRVKQKDNYEGFVDAALNALKYRGKQYGLPLDGNGRALVYRTDIFDKYGFDPPQTAKEFHQIGREINKNEDDMWAFHNCTKQGGIRAFQEWISHVYQHEDSLYKVKGDKWTLVPDADTLGQIYDNWYYQVWAADQPLANPDEKGTGWQKNDIGYVRSQYAMIECGPWLRSAFLKKADNAEKVVTDWSAVAHLPRGKGASKGTYLEVEWAGMNRHSKKKQAAWKALDLYTSTPSFKRFADNDPGNWMTPIHNGVESRIDQKDWETFVDAFKTGTALAFISWGSTREAFYETMQQVVYGRKDPYKAGADLHSRLKSIAKELKV